MLNHAVWNCGDFARTLSTCSQGRVDLAGVEQRSGEVGADRRVGGLLLPGRARRPWTRPGSTRPPARTPCSGTWPSPGRTDRWRAARARCSCRSCRRRPAARLRRRGLAAVPESPSPPAPRAKTTTTMTATATTATSSAPGDGGRHAAGAAWSGRAAALALRGLLCARLLPALLAGAGALAARAGTAAAAGRRPGRLDAFARSTVRPASRARPAAAPRAGSPHSGQNLAPSGTSAPQEEQSGGPASLFRFGPALGTELGVAGVGAARGAVHPLITSGSVVRRSPLRGRP